MCVVITDEYFRFAFAGFFLGVYYTCTMCATRIIVKFTKRNNVKQVKDSRNRRKEAAQMFETLFTSSTKYFSKVSLGAILAKFLRDEKSAFMSCGYVSNAISFDTPEMEREKVVEKVLILLFQV